MAEKMTGAQKGPKKPAKTHNQSDLTKKLQPFVKDIMKMIDAREEAHGSHTLSINHKFETVAEAVGFPKAMVRSHVAKIRRVQKAEQAIKEAKREDLEQELDLLKGFSGTDFGGYLAGYTKSIEDALSAMK